MRTFIRFSAVLLAATSLTTIADKSFAGADPTYSFNLPAKNLDEALHDVASRAGWELYANTKDVNGLKAPPISGNLTARDAILRLLQGTALQATFTDGVVKIRRSPRSGAAETHELADTDIVVTGSRIRGAPVASPVIVLDHKSMEERGQTTLGDVMRSLPQDFGGGQNPGVAADVPAASGVNVGSASTANLRGLGSDATLTLLNGQRLAYNGSRQGVDLSSMPFGMVDRIEVVADGASALYGSDAVAGVVNIILKRDYQGLQLSANLGGATDGGDFQQQYGVVTGRKSANGGVVAAYEFSQNSNIFSNDRSYTANRPDIILYPAMHHHAAALSAHQALTDTLTFEVDALYNKRWSLGGYTLSPNGWAASHYDQFGTSRSGAVAPRLKFDLSSDWHLALSGVYGTETVTYFNAAYTGSTRYSIGSACYCNEGKSVELAADGRLFDLPGGPVKLAAGAGYRINSMLYFLTQTSPYNINASQSSTYAYGELSVPVVSPAQGIAGIDHLNLSGALRYERYRGIGSVGTPKLGIIYAPVADVTLKGSWGRSFRAPTLYQQYANQTVTAYPIASLGGLGYASTAQALYVSGGNRNLKPERAESWAATLEYQPHQIPGLRLQGSYFSTIYRDRIVTPITYSSQSLSSPLYTTWAVLAPSAATVTGVTGNASAFSNLTGTTYDPAKVAAIVYNTNFNAGRQAIHGFDMLVDYRTSLGQDVGRLNVSADVAYLVSTQQLIAGAATTQLAGTLYNPPHWRGRAGLSWTREGLTVNTVTSVIGGVTDARTATPVWVGGTVTQDLTLRYAFGAKGSLLHGLAFSLTAQNLFNDKPSRIATTYYFNTAYDSTNYSPVGRFIGVGVTKSW